MRLTTLVDTFYHEKMIKERHSNKIRSPFECRLILSKKRRFVLGKWIRTETLRFGIANGWFCGL